MIFSKDGRLFALALCDRKLEYSQLTWSQSNLATKVSNCSITHCYFSYLLATNFFLRSIGNIASFGGKGFGKNPEMAKMSSEFWRFFGIHEIMFLKI